jgi:redox-sensing transcriptional repressor
VNHKERSETASEATTQRLSLLLRCLRVLETEGVHTISSYVLAERFGLNSAQIRKDLTMFGEFGVRGVGYRVAELRNRLKEVMGLDRTHVIVIVGAGNLGQALADSRNFNGEGFTVAVLFDVDGRKIGSRSRTGVRICDASGIAADVRALRAEIGVVAVPSESAAEVASELASGGVKAVLNFAPVSVPPIPGVLVKNVDLTFFLETLSFQLARR